MKFKKLMGQIRKPVSDKKYEGTTGTSAPKSKEEESWKHRFDSEADPAKKKKLKQLAHLRGFSVE